jgi:hypothetical protein
MSLTSLVNENVFKAVSEDEAMRTQVSSLVRGKDAPCHVQYYLLLKITHRRASYNVPQFTPFPLQRRLLRLLEVVSLRESVYATVAMTAQHVRVPWRSASRSRIRKRGWPLTLGLGFAPRFELTFHLLKRAQNDGRG